LDRSPRLDRPPRSRWTSFVADRDDPAPRTLYEEGNPRHRLRVEHNRDTLLIHLSGEDGRSWTVVAVDRATRRWAVGEAARQLDAARGAFEALYPEEPD
jgi:cytolysin (calcineurin-like family phosphatase)